MNKIVLVIDPARGLAVDALLFADTARVVDDGALVDLGPDADPFPAPEGHRFHEGEGAIGWRWDGTRLIAPPPPEEPIEAVRAAALAALGQAREAVYRAVVPDAATQAEYDSKAKLVRDGVPADGPVRDQLAAEAAGRGLDLAGLVAQIMPCAPIPLESRSPRIAAGEELAGK